jgi:hypothetical protein
MKHVATIVEDWGDAAVVMFPLQMPKCNHCRRPLFRNNQFHQNLPPDIKRMMQTTGIAQHFLEIDGKDYCKDCIQAGHGHFQCKMCSQMRLLNQMVEDVGYESERLCTVCFESVTASVWAAFVNDLDEGHRYDY